MTVSEKEYPSLFPEFTVVMFRKYVTFCKRKVKIALLKGFPPTYGSRDLVEIINLKMTAYSISDNFSFEFPVLLLCAFQSFWQYP